MIQDIEYRIKKANIKMPTRKAKKIQNARYRLKE